MSIPREFSHYKMNILADTNNNVANNNSAKNDNNDNNNNETLSDKIARLRKPVPTPPVVVSTSATTIEPPFKPVSLLTAVQYVVDRQQLLADNVKNHLFNNRCKKELKRKVNVVLDPATGQTIAFLTVIALNGNEFHHMALVKGIDLDEVKRLSDENVVSRTMSLATNSSSNK
jgi:hypothetical protein